MTMTNNARAVWLFNQCFLSHASRLYVTEVLRKKYSMKPHDSMAPLGSCRNETKSGHL